MSRALHYLAISVLHVVLGAGPMCFECNDIPSPQTCQYITQCGEHEDCSVESVVTSGGLTLYNVGCRPKTHCVDMRRNLYRVQDDTSMDLITCVQCCTNGDFCNRKGCGSIDVPRSGRGPYCYNCDVQSNTTSCRKITLCGPDDVCALEPKVFPPNTFYTSHCSQKEKCQTSLTHDHSSTCSVCCDSDFCNNHCNQSSIYITTAVTTKSPSTAMETVLTGKTTPSVIYITTAVTTKSPSTAMETVLTGKTTPTVIKHSTAATMTAKTVTTTTKSISTGSPDNACHGAGYFQTTLTPLCIKIHREAVNFTDAKSHCLAENAHLIQIDSVIKAIDVSRNLSHSYDYRYYWIGLSDIHHNKSLYWLNGEPLMYSNLRQNISHLSTGYAITIDSTDSHNVWIPKNAQSLYGFICEKSLATSGHGNKSLNEFCNGTEGFQMDSRGIVCVKMITDMRLNWTGAQEYCRHIKSFLLDLSHNTKQHVVMEILGTNNLLYDFWLGLYELNGIWYWEHFHQAKSFNWQPGHPSAYPESTACAVVWQGEWFATSCEDKRHFICERPVSWHKNE